MPQTATPVLDLTRPCTTCAAMRTGIGIQPVSPNTNYVNRLTSSSAGHTSRRRWVIVIVFLITVQTPAPVGGSVRHAPEVVLRGTNVFRGMSGEVRVRLDQTVRADTISVRFFGGGAGAALALLRDGDVEQGALIVLRGRDCLSGECSGGVGAGVARNFGSSILPAGGYRAILLSDVPVRVRLKFKGTHGRRIITPAAPVSQATLDVLDPEVDARDEGVFSAGSYGPSDPGGGMAVMLLWWQGSPYRGATFGSCHYTEDRGVPPGVAFAPGCPTGGTHPRADLITRGTDRESFHLISTFHFVPSGIGGWWTSPSSSPRGGAIVLRILP